MFIYCEMLISIIVNDYCFNMIRLVQDNLQEYHLWFVHVDHPVGAEVGSSVFKVVQVDCNILLSGQHIFHFLCI